MAEVVLPGSLQERIAQESYRVATVDDLPDGVTIGDADDGERVNLAGSPQPVGQSEAPSGNPADNQVYLTAPAGMPQYDPAFVQQIAQRAQQLEQQNQQLQMQQRIAALQADEQAFADSIEHLPQWQQEQMLHERERQQAQTINMYLQQRVMGLSDQLQGQSVAENAKAELIAKRMVAYHKARQAGLDFNNPVIFNSLTGDNVRHPDHMDEHIRGLLQLGVGGPKPILAGGARATNAGSSVPRKGSGDLAGLITSRSYELVPE
jgi:hypothetical protein